MTAITDPEVILATNLLFNKRKNCKKTLKKCLEMFFWGKHINGEPFMKHIQIFTDGACSGNPGKGGWGAVLKYNLHTKEMSEGYKCTTNNRMELLAAIKALEALKEPCKVTLTSDSKYLVDAVKLGWLKKWKSNNWYRTKTEKAKNVDLLIRLDAQITKHNIEFVWVKGHNGHPENERCDMLATSAIKGSNLIDDIGYIQ